MDVLPLDSQGVDTVRRRFPANLLRKLAQTHFKVILQYDKPAGHWQTLMIAFHVRDALGQHIIALLKLVGYNHPGMLGLK